ncbi:MULTISPECIES: hypothetical protein [Vibrio harveyi group]|uniref:hypothetical protein n=1 Tax=Vibrio harveyi group TaxID=717610 RepID=UPI001110C179|nr:hypothetical protein [Vibrio parahaemolyticus]MDG2761590.1 hypothetical protein [Vibrio parahaemolyticus]TMX40839.1 hypothetical protein DA098_03140 [Vibrio parahaemolyticus]TMX79856.1 hypothetical protein DA094_05060 [Vibrio parahaemolyticus]
MTTDGLTPKEEVAAIGFNSAIRLLAIHRKCTEQEAAEHVAEKMRRSIVHINHYRQVGLAPHAVPEMLEIMKAHRIPFSIHQLKPTKKVVEMYKWRNTKA